MSELNLKKRLSSFFIKQVDALVLEAEPVISALRPETPEQIEQRLIKELHESIDSAPERLIAEARGFISKIILNSPPDLEIPVELQEKSDRLISAGFTSAKEVLEIKNLTRLHKKKLNDFQAEQQAIIRYKSEINTVEYYKRNYPFAKFLTIDELNRLCKKYGLVYAHISNYIETVPDKNLQEISKAQEIFMTDIPENSFRAHDGYHDEQLVNLNFVLNHMGVSKTENFGASKLSDFLEILNRWKKFKAYSLYSFDSYLDEEELELYTELHSQGYFRERNGREYVIELSDQAGFQIAAPLSHFDQSKLQKMTSARYGYTEILKKDPIVFKNVKDGILVFSKWGIEASDPLLQNPIEN